MFSCAAVGAACKLTKISIDRIELATLSRAKKGTFLRVEKAIIELKNSRNLKKTKAVVDSGTDLVTSLAEKADENDDVKPEKRSDEPKLKRKRNQRHEDDEFEEWKAAMIKKAGLAK